MKMFKLSSGLEDEVVVVVEESSVKSPWGTSLDILHGTGGGQERNRMLVMLR